MLHKNKRMNSVENKYAEYFQEIKTPKIMTFFFFFYNLEHMKYSSNEIVHLKRISLKGCIMLWG